MMSKDRKRLSTKSMESILRVRNCREIMAYAPSLFSLGGGDRVKNFRKVFATWGGGGVKNFCFGGGAGGGNFVGVGSHNFEVKIRIA